MTTQTELDGFERERDEELEDVIRVYLNAKEELRRIKEEIQNAATTISNTLWDKESGAYRYVDGERQLDFVIESKEKLSIVKVKDQRGDADD